MLRKFFVSKYIKE